MLTDESSILFLSGVVWSLSPRRKRKTGRIWGKKNMYVCSNDIMANVCESLIVAMWQQRTGNDDVMMTVMMMMMTWWRDVTAAAALPVMIMSMNPIVLLCALLFYLLGSIVCICICHSFCTRWLTICSSSSCSPSLQRAEWSICCALLLSFGSSNRAILLLVVRILAPFTLTNCCCGGGIFAPRDGCDGTADTNVFISAWRPVMMTVNRRETRWSGSLSMLHKST